MRRRPFQDQDSTRRGAPGDETMLLQVGGLDGAVTMEPPQTAQPHTAGQTRHSPQPAGRQTTRARRVVGFVTLFVAVLVVAGGYAGWFDRLPMLHRAEAAGVEAAAVVALAGSWLCRDRHWWARTLPLLAGGVAVVTAAIAALLWLTSTVTDAYPPVFGLWVGMGLAALAGLPLIARRQGLARLVAGLLALPLTVSGALLLIDQEYGVWPTVGDLLGHDGPKHIVTGLRGLPQLSPPAGAALPAHGEFVAVDAPAARSGFAHRPGGVYLPPAYFGPGRARLPVLVVLPGTPGTPLQWISAGHAQQTVDAYAAAHGGLAPVLVFVDENGSATADTECVDGPRGNAETFLADDVPAFITGSLHLTANPSRWGIVGFSEGGTCALDLTLAHPGIYRHAVDLAGDARPNLGGPGRTLVKLYGGSEQEQLDHDPAHLLATRRYPGLTTWLGAGTGDRPAQRVAQRLAGPAATAGITVHEFVTPGRHNWQFAGAAFSKVLPDLCTELGLPATAPTAL